MSSPKPRAECDCYAYDDSEIVYCHLHESASEMLDILKEIDDWPTGSAKSGVDFKIRQVIAKAQPRRE